MFLNCHIPMLLHRHTNTFIGQYVSLEELDMLVQTEAEVEEGKKNHMEDMLGIG